MDNLQRRRVIFIVCIFGVTLCFAFLSLLCCVQRYTSGVFRNQKEKKKKDDKIVLFPDNTEETVAKDRALE